MSITLTQITDLASMEIDFGMTREDASSLAEAIVPRVIYHLYEAMAADQAKRVGVLEAHTIALTNGSGTIPARVLYKCLPDSAMADPADATVAKKMRYVHDFREFIRPLDNTLGYYVAIGGTLLLTRPAASYTPGSGMTGNMTLTTPSIPDMSAWTATGTITLPGEIEVEIVPAIVQSVRDAAPRK